MSHSCTFFPNYVKKTTVTSKSVNFESTQCDENLANDVKKKVKEQDGLRNQSRMQERTLRRGIGKKQEQLPGETISRG